MKVMILAAGRGERMRPLTDTIPKPLLMVAGKPIIVHTIDRLRQQGFNDIVINLAHLGEQIAHHLGDGSQFGVNIRYSHEGEEGLETAGGIINALSLLGEAPFIVVNGDIASDFPFATLRHRAVDLAHLVLVDNPEHHRQGDFGIDADQNLIDNSLTRFTFSGIGVYRPALFHNIPPGKSKLAPLLRQAIGLKRVSGEHHPGFWIDLGTPERLQTLNDYYQRGIHHDRPCL